MAYGDWSNGGALECEGGMKIVAGGKWGTLPEAPNMDAASPVQAPGSTNCTRQTTAQCQGLCKWTSRCKIPKRLE